VAVALTLLVGAVLARLAAVDGMAGGGVVPGAPMMTASRRDAPTHPKLVGTLAASRSYYIAVNLFNNAAILPQFMDELLVLTAALGRDNVFVSVFENGSKDTTPALLVQLGERLRAAGVGHAIVSAPAGWRQFCDQIVDVDDAAACAAAESDVLRDCPNTVRIPVMAAIRNMALLPLFNVTTLGAAPAVARRQAELGTGDGINAPPAARTRPSQDSVPQGAHLGLRHPVQLIFLNDVVLFAEDIVELVATDGGAYDMACGMDFETLKFYDTWVARDLGGASFSDWYPYVREATAAAAMRAGRPFRVFTCWNGAVTLPAAALTTDGVVFRSWRAGERRSLAADGQAGEFAADTCPASECTLFAKDLWAVGRPVIVMNPAVRLHYNLKSLFLQRVLMAPVNALLHSWANRIDVPHHALRSPHITVPVAATVPWDTPAWRADPPAVTAPRHVACGLSGDDLLPV